MNILSGVVVLTVTTVLYFKYKPKKRSSLYICLLAGIVGIISLFLSDGLLSLQLIRYTMQIIVLFCCFIQLRHEKILIDRRKARVKHCKCGKFNSERSKSNPSTCA